MSTISRHLQYINTLNFQNILALLDIHAFFPKCEIISVHKVKFLKNTRYRDCTICKWWWFLWQCTIINNLYTSWDYECWLQQDRRCLLRTRLSLNVLLHTSQRYGRSPVCTRWCIFRVPLTLNVLLHTSQRYGRSPVCTPWCTFRDISCLNVLMQTSQ